MRVIKIGLACAAVLVVMTGESKAALITYSFTGKVTWTTLTPFDADGIFTSPVAVDDTITGSLAYDTTAIDSFPDPNAGEYAYSPPSPSGITFNLPSSGFTSHNDPSATFAIFIANSAPDEGPDFFNLNSIVMAAPGISLGYLYLQLNDWTGAALNSDNLPTQLDISSFNDFSITQLLIYNSDDELFQIGFEVTSITTAPSVPEPGSFVAILSLVSFGAGAVVIRRRRAKKLAV